MSCQEYRGIRAIIEKLDTLSRLSFAIEDDGELAYRQAILLEVICDYTAQAHAILERPAEESRP
jgi:hypothetical protein